MSPDLETQLGTYAEELDGMAPSITLDEVIERTQPVAQAGRTPPPRRWPEARRIRWGVGIAALAAVVALVAIGVAALLAPRSDVDEVAPVTQPETVTPPPATPGPLPGLTDRINQVRDLALAPDGSLWTATGEGVVRWDLETGTPTVFTQRDGLPTGTVDAVAAAPDGTIWIGGEGWLGRYEGSWTTFTTADLPELEFADPVSLAIEEDGTLWAAGGVDLLLRYDGTWAVMPSPPYMMASPWTGSIAVAPDGTVWASAHEPPVVLAFDGSWRQYGAADGLPGRPSNIAVAPDGTVWVGGSGLYGAPEGDVWAAGIASFDGTEWTTYTVEDGLHSNDAVVAVGPDGTAWAVSGGVPAELTDDPGVSRSPGVSRFDGTSWTTYPDIGGGGWGVIAADGNLWLTSSEGVIGFDGRETTQLTVPIEPQSDGQALQPIVLAPDPDVAPLRMATAIGDLEFTTLQMPAGHALLGPVATPHGFVAVDEFTALRWSTDGLSWEGVLPPAEPNLLVVDGDDLIVDRDDGIFRYTWNGDAWVEVSMLGIADVDQLVFGPRGAVAVRSDTILYSSDARQFSEAERGPDLSVFIAAEDVPPEDRDFGDCRATFGATTAHIRGVFASEAGFGALTAAAHPYDEVCAPLLWFSVDGNTWDLVSPDSPFGEMSVVHVGWLERIVDRSGRYFVSGEVGGQGLTDIEPAIWTSDDGLAWQRGDVDADLVLAVAAGDLGWVALGAGSTGLDQGMWVSVDGLSWDGPYEVPVGLRTQGYFLAQLTVGADSIFGIEGFETPVLGLLQE